MNIYLQEQDCDIWNSFVDSYNPPKGRIKKASAKKLYENNAKAPRLITRGLPKSQRKKHNVEKCTSSKKLWNKLQDAYSNQSLLATKNVVKRKQFQVRQKRINMNHAIKELLLSIFLIKHIIHLNLVVHLVKINV